MKVMALEENIIFWLITGVLTFIVARMTLEFKKQKAVREGMRAILRDRILHAYDKYSKKGFAPFAAVENVTNMYVAYHNLGGNGPVTKIYNKFMQLPQVSSTEGGDEIE